MLKVALPTGLVAILALLAVSNPKQPAHSDALVEHAKARCAENALLQGLCGSVASLATLSIAYEDHVLYSTARIGKVKTLGVLGQVFVSE